VSCYTRHLGDMLPAHPEPSDTRALDGAIRRVLGMEEADCPDVWAKVQVRRDEPDFAGSIRDEMEASD
jgi:hypothetical protein